MYISNHFFVCISIDNDMSLNQYVTGPISLTCAYSKLFSKQFVIFGDIHSGNAGECHEGQEVYQIVNDMADILPEVDFIWNVIIDIGAFLTNFHQWKNILKFCLWSEMVWPYLSVSQKREKHNTLIRPSVQLKNYNFLKNYEILCFLH